MHPKTIVMHPPKSVTLSGLSLKGWDDEYAAVPTDTVLSTSASTYVITAAHGRPALLEKMALFTMPVETVVYMHSGFDTPGQIRLTLQDADGNLLMERETWLMPGAGSQGIGMSHLKPGQYKLLVSWLEGEEESVVMYQIEKLL